MSDQPFDLIASRLDNVKRLGSGVTARCPAHDDRSNSLKLDQDREGTALLHCFAGCDVAKIMPALGLEMKDLYPRREGAPRLYPSGSTATVQRSPGREGVGVFIPPINTATVQRSPGLTIADYATAKRLPENMLRSFGLTEIVHPGLKVPVIRMPYRDPSGAEAAVRYRVALDKGEGDLDRFRWRVGSKPRLYGLDRLALARARGYVTLVEGESDSHTLWCLNEPALGVPGADNWRDERDVPELAGIPVIYLVVEPDGGGDALLSKLAGSPVCDRVRLLNLGDHKDPSALYLADSERFLERWQACKESSVPLAERVQAEADAATAAAWEECADLAREPDILARVAHTLAAAGVAGESNMLRLLYLIVCSRFLPRPVSAALKGPSSGGKSFALQRVLDLFPPEAYYSLTAMSEKALVYDEEPLVHRFLVIFEAAGLSGETASYLVRTLLSEGQLRYVTVEKTAEGLRSRSIERAGPTGLLVTTTAVKLHPENETRMLTLGVSDTPEQTRDVFRALAWGADEPLDTGSWHALQVWLAGAEHRVTIPYAICLAEEVSPGAVRLRRDFGTLLTLVKTHALLHQACRARDIDGEVVATLDDYSAVRGLVADILSEGVEATVSSTIRETVAAVASLLSPGNVEDTVSVAALALHLGLDKSAASRRVRVSLDRGFLTNAETRKGRPSRLSVGDPMPEDTPILPTVETLRDRCPVAVDPEGIKTPLPSTALVPSAMLAEVRP